MLGVGTALAPAKFVMYGYREGIEETGNKNIWPCWQNFYWNSERIWLLNYLNCQQITIGKVEKYQR